jgi:hypothetical protein
VTVVIGSAIVPTLIAQKFFRPDIAPAIAFDVAGAPSGIAPHTDGEVAAPSRPAAIHGES